MALCGSPTCLGLSEWTECCRQNSRFTSILTDDEAEKLSTGYTPKSTEQANKWAVDNFEEWRKWRNEHRPQDPAPPSTELLSSGDAPLLNKWFSRYAVETRGEKGRVYPPATIHNLLCGLQRHMLALLLGFSIRRTEPSKSSMELWTIFSAACTRVGLDGK